MEELVLQNLTISVDDGGRVSPNVKNHPVNSPCFPFEWRIGAGDNCTSARFVGAHRVGNTLLLSYTDEGDGLTFTVRLEPSLRSDAVRETVTVTNTGSKAVDLTYLSSARLYGMATDGQKSWYAPDRFLFRYATNTWTREAQWKTRTLEELGILPGNYHPWEPASARITSVGSWSTAAYSPFFVLEDRETETVYYMELEGSQNWAFDLYHIGGYTAPGISMRCSAADDELGWRYTLAPGASYVTSPSVWGACHGAFEEAVGEMTDARRAFSLCGFAGKDIPVTFNDYMNCLWAQPSDKVLLPLIDAAAAAGAETFCIDAGWHKNVGARLEGVGSDWGGSKGDWEVADEKFGELGLAGVLNHMKEKGLRPGVWFELDAVNPTAAAFFLSDDCLLKRGGDPIHKGSNYFFNFRSSAVRAHLHARIDALYDLGVRYIKNDYNASTGIGDDQDTVSPAEGNRENALAFYSFIDEVKEKHPDLIIENCGSGAMRADNGTLRHFDLQSTSDQEYYEEYPTIVQGSLALMAPEKAGIWAYPYPMGFDAFFNKKYEAPGFFDGMADGEQTIFNMVTGMCGTLYLSGHIELADEKNFALVREGVATYKSVRRIISDARPVFPTAQLPMNRPGYATVGLLSRDKRDLLVAVWRKNAAEDTVRVDLSKYAQGYRAAMLYPADPHGVTYDYDGKILTVTFPKAMSARMFRLTAE